MSERPSTSAASLTWRLSEATSMVAAADVQLRQRLAALSSIGFLLGYFCMHNQWVQVAWIGIMTLAWFWEGGFQDFIDSLRMDRWLFGVTALFLLLLARSSLLESPMTPMSYWRGWLGTGLLTMSLMTLWCVARQPRSPVWLAVSMIAGASLSAVGSMLVSYVLESDAVFGRRLENWFVYGGWNTVCTGMTFGFASVWATWNWHHTRDRLERAVWLLAAVTLIFATLLTMSRGALLAVVAANAVWLLVLGWRRAWKPVMLTVGCVVLFQVCAPLIAHLGSRDVSQHLGIDASELTPELLGDGIVAANPAARFVERADNGRFAIYRAAIGSLTTWSDWTLGKGLWAENDCWSCSLWWYPEHLHSVFMDALVRGGVPGLAGLLFLLGWGLRRALALAREGEGVWLVLSSFGIAGVLFDGDSAFSMLTLPRFETLILWVPLVIASARHVTTREPARAELDVG